MNIMKIPPYQTNPAESSAPADGKTNGQAKTGTATDAGSDRVQLSQNYLDLASAQKSISGTDEVRTNKVQQIKGRLESGSYQIDAEAIAGKMLDEII